MNKNNANRRPANRNPANKNPANAMNTTSYPREREAISAIYTAFITPCAVLYMGIPD